MPETFLILLAGGMMLALAIPESKSVTRRWLRSCELVAAAMIVVSILFWLRREIRPSGEMIGYAVCGLLLAAQALMRLHSPSAARIVAAAAFVPALLLGRRLLEANPHVPPLSAGVACAGAAILCGLVLAEVILCHVDRASSVISMAALARLNGLLIAALALMMFFAFCAPLMEVRWPVDYFWQREVAFVAIRWLIGLILPMIFACVAHLRIKQQAIGRATLLIDLFAVMILVGEVIGLHLTRLTGLPF